MKRVTLNVRKCSSAIKVFLFAHSSAIVIPCAPCTQQQASDRVDTCSFIFNILSFYSFQTIRALSNPSCNWSCSGGHRGILWLYNKSQGCRGQKLYTRKVHWRTKWRIQGKNEHGFLKFFRWDIRNCLRSPMQTRLNYLHIIMNFCTVQQCSLQNKCVSGNGGNTCKW